MSSPSFDTQTAREREQLWQQVSRNRPPMSCDLDAYPAPLCQYAKTVGLLDGSPAFSAVRFRQIGQFRPNPKAGWSAMRAEEVLRTDPPAFVWITQIKAGPLTIRGRDKYIDGEGEMWIKPPVVRGAVSRGPELTQGSFTRWVAECMWLPTALFG
ncbi:hypothetical protein GF324_13300, partial [bacterium]|nr:hypothetical protein [bacterium]